MLGVLPGKNVGGQNAWPDFVLELTEKDVHHLEVHGVVEGDGDAKGDGSTRMPSVRGCTC
jgi:hypothetical protein